MNPLLMPLLSLAGKAFDRFFPDPAQAAEAKLKLIEMEQKGELAFLDAEVKIALGQAAINLEEAKSPNWFIAGARPFVMWVCGVAFCYASIIEPIARFISSVWFGYSGQFPAIDTNLTIQVLLGILGLGTLRTYEKSKNAEGNR